MKLYFASGNAHKAAELQAMAEAERLPVEVVSASEVGGMPPVKEDTGSFAGNARKKARALRARLPVGAWVLADDSGICVDALHGGPGVESAYFAGPQADDAANLRKLIEIVRTVPEADRGAHYECVLLLAGPDGAEEVFTGRCEGRLLPEPRGEGGFGYDPIFVPSGHERTFAELGDMVKNDLSHRRRAWAALCAGSRVLRGR